MSQHIDVSKLVSLLADLKEEFQREANQSILKHDPSQGMSALGGLDAVQRVERRIKLSLGVQFPEIPAGQIRVLRGRRG
jgi:hypothetical protein